MIRTIKVLCYSVDRLWLILLTNPLRAVVTNTDQKSNPITLDELTEVADAAIDRWIGFVPAVEAEELSSKVEFQLVDLPGNLLGVARGTSIMIDLDAAGVGWFVDPTPEDDMEFTMASYSDMTAQ